MRRCHATAILTQVMIKRTYSRIPSTLASSGGKTACTRSPCSTDATNEVARSQLARPVSAAISTSQSHDARRTSGKLWKYVEYERLIVFKSGSFAGDGP